MILEFLKENYQLFIVGVIGVVEVVVFFLKKRPQLNAEDHIKCLIDEYLPSFIILAEQSGTSGASKLCFVVDALLSKIKKIKSSKDNEYWKKYIIDKVEAILSTPQKKGS